MIQKQLITFINNNIITQVYVDKPYCDIPILKIYILITMYTRHTVNKITNLQLAMSNT